MAPKALPSPEVLRQLLRYEPETGKLFWRERSRDMFGSNRIFLSWNARYAGAEALVVKFMGYRSGGVNGARVLAHRAVWAMQTGAWPEADIDHINGVRDDNRLENLRAVTRAENLRNTRRRDNNTSGFTGVDYFKAMKSWRARIHVNGAEVVLGYFATAEAAGAARKSADAVYGYHANHGR